jgi:hypothetical protein
MQLSSMPLYDMVKQNILIERDMIKALRGDADCGASQL